MPSLGDEDRLDSWKEIAAYLRRGERTVRRWEQAEGLPTHRHVHNKRASVYAFKSEVDAWWQNRGSRLDETGGDRRGGLAALLERVRPAWIGVLVVVLAIGGYLLWLFAGRSRQIESPSLTLRPLTAYPGSERFPTFSPDGRQVAFSWQPPGRDDFDIYIQLVDSSTPLQLTNDSRHDWNPVWSPDGQRIAFLRWSADVRAEVVVTPALPGGETVVTDIAPLPGRGPFYGGYLAWSPNGNWLAVIDKERPGDPWGLFAVDINTGEKHRLTSPPVHLDAGPAFSAHGDALAFVRVTTFGVSELFVLEMSADMQASGQPRQLTSTKLLTTSPVWTSDGSVLFASGPMWTERGLWRIQNPRSDQASAVHVGDLPDGYILGITSDSRRLAYAVEQFDPGVWRLDRSEGGQFGSAQPFAPSTRIDCNAQFSPDGRRVAFMSTRSGSTEIWIANADGSKPQQLTSMGGNPTGAPRWSPDGTRIAFNSGPQGQADVFVIKSDGGVPRHVTDNPVNESLPGWSKDGRSIYFASGGQVWKTVAPDGPDAAARSAPVQVTRGGGMAAVESNGGMLFYSKATLDGMSLWHVPVGGGEERQVVDSLRDWSSFAVADRGIYFVPRGNPASGGPLRFLDLTSGIVTTIAEISKPVFIGISVTRDGRSILYSQVDREESDLMLVELTRK